MFISDFKYLRNRSDFISTRVKNVNLMKLSNVAILRVYDSENVMLGCVSKEL